MGKRQYRNQAEWSALMKQQASRSMPGENLLQGLTSRFSGIRGQAE